MKIKSVRRLKRNLERAKETIDQMIDNLELDEDGVEDCGFEYMYQAITASIGDLTIARDLLYDDLRQ